MAHQTDNSTALKQTNGTNQIQAKSVIFRRTHRPERKRRRPAGDDEPDPAVADEVLERADEQRRPEGEDLAESSGEESDAVAEILRDAESRDLALVIAHGLLDHRRKAAENVADAGERLHPHCSDEDEPSVVEEGGEARLNPTHPERIDLFLFFLFDRIG